MNMSVESLTNYARIENTITGTMLKFLTKPIDPCPPLPKTAQHPSASMMPSSDVMDPKLTLPDAVALTAQPDKVDTSTPSAVKAVGNGSSVDPIIEPPLSMPESFVLPVSSYCSLPEKKKSSAICIQAPQLQQGK